MTWQDIILTIVGTVFALALVPQVYHGYKTKTGPIKYQTSVTTGVGLFVVSYVYYTLGLTLSTIISVVAALLWMTFVVQRWIYEK